MQKTQTRPQILRVLDLASTGRAAYGYRNFRKPTQRIEVKAFYAYDEVPKRQVSDFSRGKTKVSPQYGSLPICLLSEPSEFYDRVHLHMA